MKGLQRANQILFGQILNFECDDLWTKTYGLRIFLLCFRFSLSKQSLHVLSWYFLLLLASGQFHFTSKQRCALEWKFKQIATHGSQTFIF